MASTHHSVAAAVEVVAAGSHLEAEDSLLVAVGEGREPAGSRAEAEGQQEAAGPTFGRLLSETRSRRLLYIIKLY